MLVPVASDILLTRGESVGMHKASPLSEYNTAGWLDCNTESLDWVISTTLRTPNTTTPRCIVFGGTFTLGDGCIEQ